MRETLSKDTEVGSMQLLIYGIARHVCQTNRRLYTHALKGFSTITLTHRLYFWPATRLLCHPIYNCYVHRDR